MSDCNSPLAQAMSRHRGALYGDRGNRLPVLIDKVSGHGLYSAPQYRPDLIGNTGIKSGMIAAVRLRKDEWPDYASFQDWLEKTVSVSVSGAWVKLTVKGVNSADLSGEWILHLENIP